MSKRVKPSESSVHHRTRMLQHDGKFYVEEACYDELLEKHKKARDTINYLLDKWFLTIEKRLLDQERVMAATSRYERAVKKISELEKELRGSDVKIVHKIK